MRTDLPSFATYRNLEGFHEPDQPDFILRHGCAWCGGPTPCECDTAPLFDPDLFYYGTAR